MFYKNTWRYRLLCTCTSMLLLTGLPAIAEDIDWGEIAEQRSNNSGKAIVGSPLKPYILNTIDDKAIEFSQYLGRKPMYLKFWATWCTTCLAQMPHFEKIAKQYQNDIEVIAVNTGINDDIEDVQAYLTQHPLSMPVVRDDGSLANDLKLTVTPQHVLIDHTGRVVWLGHKDDERFMKVLDQVAKRSYTPVINAIAKANNPTISIENQQLESAPKFTTTNGESAAIINKQSPTHLWFTAPWCEWYLAESKPDTSAACKAVRELAVASENKSWLGISLDVWADKDDVLAFTREHKITIPFILDDEKLLFNAFNIRDIPAIVIIQPDGSFEKKSFANAEEVKAFKKEFSF